MAITKLPVNFKDDVIDTSVSDKRRYNLITNSDGTTSIEDVTTYEQIGSDFGAEQVNQTNGAVNELIETVEEFVEKDFILANKKKLDFVNKVCTITDIRITADSLADVYFTSETIEYAGKCFIEVETYNGSLKLTSIIDVKEDLVATIKVRVI